MSILTLKARIATCDDTLNTLVKYLKEGFDINELDEYACTRVKDLVDRRLEYERLLYEMGGQDQNTNLYEL